MPDPEAETHALPGDFTVAPNEVLFGQLTIDGAKSLLYVHDNKKTHPEIEVARASITGILHNLSRVTLIDCIPVSNGMSLRRGGGFRYAEIYPHYVVVGDRHVNPDDKVISCLEFVTQDMITIFYDTGAFGSAHPKPSVIQELLEKTKSRSPSIGEHPLLQYFTGKDEIFRVDTPLGELSAWHRPTVHSATPKGLRVDNKIIAALNTRETVDFKEAIHRLITVLKYLSLLSGRPQSPQSLHIRLADTEQASEPLQVHCSARLLSSTDSARRRDLHVSDVLIDAIRDHQAFTRVTQNWFARAHEWRDARARFFTCFFSENSFDHDRLVGAANMFDLIPRSVVSNEASLPTDVETAKKVCEAMFKKLADSPERQRALQSLGQLARKSLREKIRQRINVISEAVPGGFPDLAMVTDEAVRCRNHYVHGSDGSFDYANNGDMVVFFTSALEFVFGASDLIDSGWNIRSWLSKHTALSHPFATFKSEYAQALRRMHELLGY